MTTTAEEAADWAVGWLQNRSGWLLILDNVEQRSDVEPLLGQLQRAILITTRRNVDWETMVDGCLSLDMLDRKPAVRLLLEQRSGGCVDRSGVSRRIGVPALGVATGSRLPAANPPADVGVSGSAAGTAR